MIRQVWRQLKTVILRNMQGPTKKENCNAREKQKCFIITCMLNRNSIKKTDI